jgi:hypothetical protein
LLSDVQLRVQSIEFCVLGGRGRLGVAVSCVFSTHKNKLSGKGFNILSYHGFNDDDGRIDPCL